MYHQQWYRTVVPCHLEQLRGKNKCRNKVNVNIGLPGQVKIKIADGTIMIMKIKDITVAADCHNVHYSVTAWCKNSCFTILLPLIGIYCKFKNITALHFRLSN